MSTTKPLIPLKINGKVNPFVFSKDAEEWAEKIYNEGKEGSKKLNKNNISQLRKFYDELFKLNQRAFSPSDNKKNVDETWEESILPQLHMLIPKVVYAKARKLVSDGFVKFLKFLIGEVKTKEDLKIATQFFEAFIGFYRKYGNK